MQIFQHEFLGLIYMFSLCLIVALIVLVFLVDRLQQFWTHLSLREDFLLIEYFEGTDLRSASVL